MSKHFKEKEYTCKCGCGYSDISAELLDKLDKARELAGIPFVLTSGLRCEKHNVNVGGAKSSAHVTGEAVDIKAVDSRSRSIILNACIKAGFNRIGLHKSFIHVDVAKDKDQDVVWFY